MNHFFSRKEQNSWQFVSLIISLGNSKWSSAKPLWHEAWVEADFNSRSVTLKFGRMNYLFNSCIYFQEMFVVVGLLCHLPSEIKQAESELSINTLRGAKSRGGCTSIGAESLFFPLSQDVSLCWHHSSGWHSIPAGMQALVAASLQKTPRFAMPWKQIFQVLSHDNVSV